MKPRSFLFGIIRSLFAGLSFVGIFVSSCLFSSISAAATLDDLEYSVYDDYVVIRSPKNLIEGVLVIPDYISGKPVTEIAFHAFSRQSLLTEVVLPSTLESIGDGAFWECTKLTSVTFSEGLLSIGRETFHECSSLLEISIPDSVSSLGMHAFRDCSSLESVTVGKNVLEIPYGGFSSCTSLRSVSLPEGLLRIETDAFDGCSSLLEIVIPDSVLSIGGSAFEGCEKLESVTVGKSVSVIPFYCFRYCRSLANVSLPDGLEKIGELSFADCDSLELIHIPETVTHIYRSAFYRCGSLAVINIPATVEAIGETPFQFCYNLQAINVAPANLYYSSLDGILFNRNKTELIKCPSMYPTSVTLPESVVALRKLAFSYCLNVDIVTIPQSVTEIPDGAFSGSLGLESIVIPHGVTSIGEYSFYNCGNLGSIEFPATLTHIGRWAFAGCKSLTDVTLPESLDFLPTAIFRDCEKLRSLSVSSNLLQIGEQALFNCTALSDFEIPDSTISIYSDAFRNCESLTAVTIPESTTTIGWRGVFAGCKSLQSINVEPGNSFYYSVGGVLFDSKNDAIIQCPGGFIGEYLIPAGTTSVNALAFSGCSFLCRVYIPESVLVIGDGAFHDSENLVELSFHADNPNFSVFEGALYNKDRTEILQVLASEEGEFRVPEGVTDVHYYAFEKCSKIEKVVLPSSIDRLWTGLGNKFAGCSSLKEFVVDGDNPYYGSLNGVLYGNNFTDLERYPQALHGNVELAPATERIGFKAFSECNGLEKIVLTDSLLSIDDYGFQNCKNLKKLTLPASLEHIGTKAFEGCEELDSVYFNGSVPEAIYSAAFKDFSGVVYYFSEAEGFASPYWNYEFYSPIPAVDMGPKTDVKTWLINHGLHYDTNLMTDPLDIGRDLFLNFAFARSPDEVGPLHSMPAVQSGRAGISFFAPRSDVGYTVETSQDLEKWTTAGVVQSNPDEDGVVNAWTEIDDDPVFFRLIVAPY